MVNDNFIYWYIYAIILFLLLITTSIQTITPYFNVKNVWIDSTKTCIDFFSKEENFENISFIFNNIKYKYLRPYLLYFIVCFPFTLLFVLLGWFIIKDFSLLISSISIMIISYIATYFSIKKIIKKIKKFAFELKNISKAEATKNFKNYRTIMKNQNVQSFTILYLNKKDVNNSRFQLNQKRFKDKIKQLVNLNLDQNEYNFELLNLYILYLKTYAFFLKSMKYNLRIWQMNNINISLNWKFYNYFIKFENETTKPLWENINKLLINNFFAFVNQFEKKQKKIII